VIPRPSRVSIAALVAATLLVASSSAPAWAQADIPSVDVAPANPDKNGPNKGAWFYLELGPGQTGTVAALLRNPADVPQTVKVYLRDLVFAKDGTPSISDGEQRDIGAWGAPNVPEILVPARGEARVKVTITPPVGADPGDHVGALVSESKPQGEGLRVVLRTATRFYVTLPGDARRGVDIADIRWSRSTWWPRSAAVTAFIRNTGRVRLVPQVTIGGAPARGASPLLSRSVEQYFGEVRIPFYGGPVSAPVIFQDQSSGVARRAEASIFVIPWGLLALLALGALVTWRGAVWWDKRGSRLASIQADIRRLETLVTHRPREVVPAPEISEEEAEVEAIMVAIKRARRAGAKDSLERLALALHETGADALEVILEALRTAGPERRTQLIEAGRQYGTAALLASREMAARPPGVTAQLMYRVPPGKRTAARRPKARETEPRAKTPLSAPGRAKTTSSPSAARPTGRRGAKRTAPSPRHKSSRRS